MREPGRGGTGVPTPDTAPLNRGFYARAAPIVARDLLGTVVIRRLPDGSSLSARIVETEAYQEDDPAAHSYRGPTDRNRVMFGPPGHLYVYFSYGMHWCMNVVTGADGEGSAVLLRAAQPIDGIEAMRRLRGLDDLRLLCAGPGRLTQALAVTREQNGVDLVGSPELRVAEGEPVPDELVAVGPRVGISAATERPWRFAVAGSPFVSRSRPGPRPSRPRRGVARPA